MRGLFVRGGRFGSFINFNENKAGRVVILLKDIKTGNAFLKHTVGCILESGLFEGFDELRFDMHMHVNDIHFSPYLPAIAFPMICAEALTEIVNPKKGPKS